MAAFIFENVSGRLERVNLSNVISWKFEPAFDKPMKEGKLPRNFREREKFQKSA